MMRTILNKGGIMHSLLLNTSVAALMLWLALAGIGA